MTVKKTIKAVNEYSHKDKILLLNNIKHLEAKILGGV